MRNIKNEGIPTGYITMEEWAIPTSMIKQYEEVIVGWEEAPTRNGWKPVTARLIPVSDQQKIKTEFEKIQNERKVKETEIKSERQKIQDEMDSFISPYIGKKVNYMYKGNVFFTGVITGVRANLQEDFVNMCVSFSEVEKDGKQCEHIKDKYFNFENFHTLINLA